MGAALGSFERYFESAHPPLTDEERLAHYRGNMRRQIRRGFNKAAKLVGRIINEVGCRQSDPPQEDADGQITFNPRMDLCGVRGACGVKSYAAKWRGELEKIRQHLSSLPSLDNETILRIRGLRELYRKPKENFDKGSCYRSGDALIVHEAPKDCPVVTKNKKHIQPVCDHLSKPAVYY